MYDVVVVGGGCAGSLTALLLARRQHRVLLVEREACPHGAVGAQYVAPQGVAALADAGLLEGLVARGCTAEDRTVLRIGSETLEVVGTVYSPPRAMLTTVLAESAAQAGADVREPFVVTDLVWDGDRVCGIVGHGRTGRSVVEPARLVVGADGRHSLVAKTVGAECYREAPAASCRYASAWAAVEATPPELHFTVGRALAVLPAHDGLTWVVASRPVTDWARFKRAPEAMFLNQLQDFPALAKRFHGARRETRLFGTAETEGCFRRPWGPGWALVGDAGHHRDAIVLGGTADGLLQARLLADALDEGLTGRMPMERALAAFHRARDEGWRRQYEATCAVASFEWSEADLPSLLEVATGGQPLS